MIGGFTMKHNNNIPKEKMKMALESGKVKVIQDNFSGALKRARATARVTQRQLSDQTGIPLPSIRAWEQGKVLPNFDNMEILLSFFKRHYCHKPLEAEYIKSKGQ